MCQTAMKEYKYIIFKVAFFASLSIEILAYILKFAGLFFLSISSIINVDTTLIQRCNFTCL